MRALYILCAVGLCSRSSVDHLVPGIQYVAAQAAAKAAKAPAKVDQAAAAKKPAAKPKAPAKPAAKKPAAKTPAKPKATKVETVAETVVEDAAPAKATEEKQATKVAAGEVKATQVEPASAAAVAQALLLSDCVALGKDGAIIRLPPGSTQGCTTETVPLYVKICKASTQPRPAPQQACIPRQCQPPVYQTPQPQTRYLPSQKPSLTRQSIRREVPVESYTMCYEVPTPQPQMCQEIVQPKMQQYCEPMQQMPIPQPQMCQEFIPPKMQAICEPMPAQQLPMCDQPLPQYPVCEQPLPQYPVCEQPMQQYPVCEQPMPQYPVCEQPLPQYPVCEPMPQVSVCEPMPQQLSVCETAPQQVPLQYCTPQQTSDFQCAPEIMRSGSYVCPPYYDIPKGAAYGTSPQMMQRATASMLRGQARTSPRAREDRRSPGLGMQAPMHLYQRQGDDYHYQCTLCGAECVPMKARPCVPVQQGLTYEPRTMGNSVRPYPELVSDAHQEQSVGAVAPVAPAA